MSDLGCVGKECLKVVGPCSPNGVQEFGHWVCRAEPRQGIVASGPRTRKKRGNVCLAPLQFPVHDRIAPVSGLQ